MSAELTTSIRFLPRRACSINCASGKPDAGFAMWAPRTHDRALAKQLAGDRRVDVLMHRFNMAHRKATHEVFPAAIRTSTPVVAFTATRWGTLLEPHPQCNDDPPSAADCYR